MHPSIIRPTLIINKDISQANIRRMASKAKASDVIFRPHFKTHQSLQVGNWFRDAGIDRITVSSLSMAKEFAEDGWRDITIAFPANIRETAEYNLLGSKIKLNLIIDSPEVAMHLAANINYPTGLFVEIDNGYGRSGVHHSDRDSLARIIEILDNAQHLLFVGFLTHAGNTYAASTKNEIEQIYSSSMQSMQQLKEKYPKASLSVGDTPSCSIVEDLGAADEIRPGNFVFYDLMQYYLGSCSINDIAVSVACPVTGIYPEREELVIYGGAVHLSKEYVEDGGKNYGLIVRYTEDGWTSPVPDTRLVSLSQEHGIIKTNPEFLQTVKHGDILGVLPIHSCLTANLLRDNVVVL